MGALDYQLGVVDESTYGTAVTVTRFFEYQDSPTPLRPVAARTVGQPFRTGSRGRIQNRAVPYQAGGEGTLEIDVMTKGFGFFLKHLLGNVATTGAGPYTHTATEGTSSSLIGDSFTAQLNYPFHPTGSNQALTFAGGKISKWAFSNTVDGHLRASLDCDFASVATGTALATASYPSAMENLSWTGGVVTIGGTPIDLDDFKIEVDNGIKADRRQIRGNSAKKEPTPGMLTGSVEMTADWDALATAYNKVHATALATLYAQVVGTWTNGANTLVVTVPALRFDDLAFAGDPGALKQTIKGEIEWNGTNSFVTVAYTTTDVTP